VTGEDIQTGYDWPDFIGIGAIKSGTTWLHACLAEHPEILTPNTKELEYFSKRFDLGISWYKDQFAGVNGRICGESTPAYLHTEGCAERIYTHNPRTKLIVCLRNPVDRAISHFMMNAREAIKDNKQKIEEFEEVILTPDNIFLSYGLYAKQLGPFISRFGTKRIHFILFDDIVTSPLTVVQNVYQFLNVQSDFIPNALYQRINPSSKYRSIRIFRILRKIVRFTEQHLFPTFILNIKTSGMRDHVISYFRIEQQQIQIPDLTRQYLINYFRSPNEELQKLTGIDLASWQEGTFDLFEEFGSNYFK
jgi:hypothetical protein